MKQTYITEHKFADFDIHPLVLKGLAQKNYEFCTPIQSQTLPVLLSGHDIAGQAQTGTGKTLAFLVGVFHHLLTTPPSPSRQTNQPRAIIMAPTRELAIQIHRDAIPLIESTGITAGLAYGGEPVDKQAKKLENGIDILIGTTGRTIDFCKQNVINLGAIQVVVMDEADRMFDLGFIKDVRFLFQQMPKPSERRNMMYSATLSYRVQELAFEHMQDPVHLEVEPEHKTNTNVKEELFHPSNDEKMHLLQTLIEEEWLLTGDVAQNQREEILDSFKRGDIDILVATDVAARGLHIPQVTHVFNYDLPDDCEDYVHRIGRTGRAGETGCAISFACERYALNLPAIEDYIGHAIPISSYNSDALLTDLPEPLKYHHSRPGYSGSRYKDNKNGGKTAHHRRNSYNRKNR